MSIINLIREQKQSFRRLQQNKDATHRMAAEVELKRLKEERLRVEERASLARAKSSELDRISKGNQDIRSNAPVRRFGRNLATFINEGKTKMQKIKGSSTGSTSNFNLGSKISAPGSRSSSPFSLGGSGPFNTTPKEKPKPKEL